MKPSFNPTKNLNPGDLSRAPTNDQVASPLRRKAKSSVTPTQNAMAAAV